MKLKETFFYSTINDFENFQKTWVNTIDNIHEKYGSWENRKGFKSWDMVEIR